MKKTNSSSLTFSTHLVGKATEMMMITIAHVLTVIPFSSLKKVIPVNGTLILLLEHVIFGFSLSYDGKFG